jgi:hypothetical protein
VHLRQGLAAGLLARAARRGTDTAMFMHVGVGLTFLTARPARCGTSFEAGPKHFDIAAGAARGHGARCSADVGAVEIETNTLGQVLDHIFAQAGIGTGCAGLGTGVALLDATQQSVGGATLHMRMGADHFANLHEISPVLR